jgi:hypothetical protein
MYNGYDNPSMRIVPKVQKSVPRRFSLGWFYSSHKNEWLDLRKTNIAKNKMVIVQGERTIPQGSV